MRRTKLPKLLVKWIFPISELFGSVMFPVFQWLSRRFLSSKHTDETVVSLCRTPPKVWTVEQWMQRERRKPLASQEKMCKQFLQPVNFAVQIRADQSWVERSFQSNQFSVELFAHDNYAMRYVPTCHGHCENRCQLHESGRDCNKDAVVLDCGPSGGQTADNWQTKSQRNALTNACDDKERDAQLGGHRVESGWYRRQHPG
jgi:hypothetical protein